MHIILSGCLLAVDAGLFKAELIEVPYKYKQNELVLESDEGIRGDISLEKITALESVFVPNGTVTAANASAITDGASALIICNMEIIKKFGLKPLAEIVDWEVSGIDPCIMGLGPVPAIQRLLQRNKLNFSDIGQIEINEAFAPQVIGVCRELGIEKELDETTGKVNPHGGAIAIGHPLAASGARILTTLCHSMSMKGHRYGLGSACIGGGQGFAMVIRSVR